MHLALAGIAQTPELALAEDEAQRIAAASAKVAAHYDGLKVAQKYLDWAALGAAGFSVYGPRVIAIYARKTNEKTPARTQTVDPTDASNLFQYPGHVTQ